MNVNGVENTTYTKKKYKRAYRLKQFSQDGVGEILVGTPLFLIFMGLLFSEGGEDFSAFVLIGPISIILILGLIIHLLTCFRNYGIDFPKYKDWVSQMIERDEEESKRFKETIKKNEEAKRKSEKGKEYFNNL